MIIAQKAISYKGLNTVFVNPHFIHSKFIVQPKTEIAVERLSSISVIHQDCEWIQFQYEAKFSFIVILLFDVNILIDIFLLIEIIITFLFVYIFNNFIYYT